MFLHICFVSLCVCGRVSLQRRANIEVTGIYKKTAKTIDIKPAFNATLVVETNPGKGPVTYG